MLPAQPPHSRRISPIWNDTESTCVCSGRMCRANRSGNTMMVSNASDPQISVRAALMLRRLQSRRRLAAYFANDELLPAGHGQRFGYVTQQNFPVRVAVGRDAALEATNRLTGDEAITMDAHEPWTKFLLELGQRFLEKVFALAGSNGDVFEFRFQIDHIIDRDQHDA